MREVGPSVHYRHHQSLAEVGEPCHQATHSSKRQKNGWTGGVAGLHVKDNIMIVIILCFCTKLYSLHSAFMSIF